jgi:transposase-like protein
MTQHRRKFSGEEKVKILRRHLIDKVPVSDLCEEVDIHPTLFYRWQKDFFEYGAAAFDRRGDDGQSRRLERKVEALEKKLADKDEVIAEIAADHVRLKKSLGED